MRAKLSSFLKQCVTFIIPWRCLVCHEEVTTPHSLCAACWSTLHFITPPYCKGCGHPFEFEIDEETFCGACLKKPPLFDRARAAFSYTDTSRQLLLQFKHGDQTQLAPAFAKWMHQAGRALLEEADLIIPVPLHWTRLVGRKYNQAALLAMELGRVHQKPVLYSTLRRLKRTPSQGNLSAKERYKNVQGAFYVPEKKLKFIRGQKCLLIDDVLTSGATVEGCADVLKKAGAIRVDVLTVARVKKFGT